MFPSINHTRLLLIVYLLTTTAICWAIPLSDTATPEPDFSYEHLDIPPESAPIFQQDIPRLTWTAGQLLKQGKLAEASFLCERLLQVQPGNVEARAHLAATYMGLGEKQRFNQEREMLTRQAPDSAAIYLSLASTYQALQQFDQAEAAYKQGLEMARDKIDLLLGLGALYHQQQDLTQARKQYLTVLEQKGLGDKPYLKASSALCRIDLQEKRYPAVIARAREIIERYPPLPQGYLLLGTAYRGEGQPELAVSTYQGLIDANPQIPRGYHELALTHLEDLDRPEAALRFAQEGVRRFPQDARSLDILGWIAYQTGHYPQAVEQLRRASLLSQGDPQILYHLGLALQKSGDHPQAKEAFQTALERINPEQKKAFARELQKRLE